MNDYLSITDLILAVLPWIAVALLCWWLLRRPAFRGYDGALRLRVLLGLFFSNRQYHLVHNYPLELDGKTEIIDHILVSRYGVFVIETRNMKGGISGRISDSLWTQKLFFRSRTFENPVLQNAIHKATLRRMIRTLPENLISLVVFVGTGKFRNPMPANVTTIAGAIGFIKSFEEEILSQGEVDAILRRLQNQSEPDEPADDSGYEPAYISIETSEFEITRRR